MHEDAYKTDATADLNLMRIIFRTVAKSEVAAATVALGRMKLR
jgi:hypothetical protein